MKTFLAVAMGATLAVVPFGCANTAEDCALIGMCGGQDVLGTGGMGGAGGMGMGMGMGGAGGMAPVCQPSLMASGDPDLQSAENVHYVGSDDSLVVTGHFLGSLPFGPTTTLMAMGPDPESFIARFSADLKYKEAFQLRANLLDSAVDESGQFVAVGTHSGVLDLPMGCSQLPAAFELFVFKLDTTGKCVWSKSYPLDAGTEIAAHIAIGAMGDVALAGAFAGGIQFQGNIGKRTSVGTKDVFVAKLDAIGDLTWAGSYGDLGNAQEARAVVVDGTGNVVIAGDYQGKLYFNDPNIAPISSANRAGFAAMFAGDGNSVPWRQAFTVTTGMQHVTAMALDGPNVVIAGDSDGTSSVTGTFFELVKDHRLFVSKLSLPDGKMTLLKGFLGLGSPRINDITRRANGQIVLTGQLDEKLDFGDGELGIATPGERFFWTVLDNDPTKTHSQAIGDDVIGKKRGLGVAANTTYAFVAGQFEGMMSISGQPRMSEGNDDMFVAKLCLP